MNNRLKLLLDGPASADKKKEAESERDRLDQSGRTTYDDLLGDFSMSLQMPKPLESHRVLVSRNEELDRVKDLNNLKKKDIAEKAGSEKNENQLSFGNDIRQLKKTNTK